MLDFLVFTLLFTLIVHWVQSKPFYWRNASIPYSIPLPIAGNTIEAFYKPFHELFQSFYRKAGDNPFYGFHLFGSPALMAKDPAIIKDLMVKYSDYFMSNGFYSAPYDPINKGVFFAEGEEWRTIRSKLTLYFTPGRLKSMLPTVTPLTEKFSRKVLENGKYGSVEVGQLARRLFVDVLINTIFGLESDSLDNPESFFYKVQAEMMSYTTGLRFLVGDMSPSLYHFFGFRVFSHSTSMKMEEFIIDVINQRLKGIGTRPDFMQGMVELMQKENAKENHKNARNIDGTPKAKFDCFTVSGQCLVMYLAGIETTANILSFILYELAINPDIQDIAREEINQMLSTTHGKLEYDDLVKIDYIHKIFFEAMRKYPAIGTYSRKCTKQIDIKGVKIPVGTKIMLSPLAMHNDPKYFPEPHKFLPERFSDESTIIPGSYIPYGQGPRTCIGIKLAEIEVTLALCKLLPKAKLLICNKTEIPIKLAPSPSTSPLNGVWLNIEEIK